MRKIIPLTALLLVSCGSGQTANNAAVAEEGGSTEVLAGNDLTAIDAATGEAANMAADVDYSFNEADSNVSNAASATNTTNASEPVPKPKAKLAEPKPAAPAPAANEAAPATTNANSL